MRAPYISMSESAELPMLMAEDLMWGAQPDLKQTLNINRKPELNINNHNGESANVDQQLKTNATYQQQQQQKSTMESSLASLLCNQIMQHHQQQLNLTEQQVILSQQPDVKFEIMDQDGNLTIVSQNSAMNQDQETRTGW